MSELNQNPKAITLSSHVHKVRHKSRVHLKVHLTCSTSEHERAQIKTLSHEPASMRELNTGCVTVGLVPHLAAGHLLEAAQLLVADGQPDGVVQDLVAVAVVAVRPACRCRTSSLSLYEAEHDAVLHEQREAAQNLQFWQ